MLFFCCKIMKLYRTLFKLNLPQILRILDQSPKTLYFEKMQDHKTQKSSQQIPRPLEISRAQIGDLNYIFNNQTPLGLQRSLLWHMFKQPDHTSPPSKLADYLVGWQCLQCHLHNTFLPLSIVRGRNDFLANYETSLFIVTAQINLNLSWE